MALIAPVTPEYDAGWRGNNHSSHAARLSKWEHVGDCIAYSSDGSVEWAEAASLDSSDAIRRERGWLNACRYNTWAS